MHRISTAHGVIASLSLIVFVLSFIILYRETQEVFSSLTAAVLSSALVWISLVMLYWLSKVFMK